MPIIPIIFFAMSFVTFLILFFILCTISIIINALYPQNPPETPLSPQPKPTNTEVIPHQPVTPPSQSLPPKNQFFVKKKLLTNMEHRFLLSLMMVRPEKLAIACKVGLWAVVHNLNKYDWNKINQKHLDFVLYDLHENNIVLVIELDDPSHLKEKVQQRDKIKDDILKDAGIPILRIPTEKAYNLRNLRERILDALQT